MASTLITIADGAPQPVQAVFYGSANTPTGAVVPVTDSLGNFPITGRVLAFQGSTLTGLGGLTDDIFGRMAFGSVNTGVATALMLTAAAGATVTNSFSRVNTVGSALQIQTFACTSTLQSSAGFAAVLTMSPNYIANTPFNINVVCSLFGSSPVASVKNINVQAYSPFSTGGTAGPAMTNGTAVAVTSLSGTAAQTCVFTCTPGTAPLFQSGSPIYIEVDTTITNTSGTTGIAVYDINLT